MQRISAEQRCRTSSPITLFKNIFLICQALALIGFLMLLGCAKATGASSVRKGELTPVLAALLKIPPPPADPDEPSNENPGWYDPANRHAVRDFIAKYPDTEEAYQAGVWLIFAQGSTEVYGSISVSKSERGDKAKVREKISSYLSEQKGRRAALAEKLKRIISRTSRPGTAKTAKLLRAGQLLSAEEYAGFAEQAYDILAHIKEYESEKDKHFLRFADVTETPPAEIEPTLRDMLVVSECHQHHLGKALALAKELKQNFPKWHRREIDGNIDMLEVGRSPFPTREDMMDRGRSLSNDWARTAPIN